MIKTFWFCLLTTWLLGAGAQAQELNCTVTINADQLAAQQKPDLAYFNQLRGVITELMNARRWTSDQITPDERIACALNITLQRSAKLGEFQGTAQFVVTRPVYGTNYETTTFSYVDRAFNFTWLPTVPVLYRENQYADELTSLLAFYAYVALAVDYDTFGRLGGNVFVQQAYQIAQQAEQGPNKAGWGPGGDRRNRYWLVENMQSQQVLPFREGMYAYHRLGLDQFAKNPVQVRKQVLDLLTTIRQINLQKPGAVLINSFFDAKSEELYNILYEGTNPERQRAFELLSQLDPGKTEAYRKLLR